MVIRVYIADDSNFMHISGRDLVHIRYHTRTGRSAPQHGTASQMLTGQFADKLTRGQSSRGLDNSPTSQIAERDFI